MMERNLHKDALIVTKDTDVVHLMQYENNYTKLIIDNLEIEEGYDYFVVFKKDHDCVVYEMPIESNEIPLGAYITNQIGVYYFDIVYRNDSIDQVVIGSPFRIIVEKGIYNQPTSEVNFPEPIQSKYQDLINLINEVRYDLDNDVFKGDKGDTGNGIDHITFQNYTLTFHMTDGSTFTTPSIRGEKGEKGDTYTITESDYEAIGDIVTEREQSRFNQYVETKKEEFDTHAEEKADQEIARINADPIAQDVQKLKDEKMETYRVEVWDIDTPNARFLHIKNDGTSERVYYADLIDKYADPKYFLYCEYVTFGVTLIPSLPPLDYDQILEFTSNWEYGGVVHQSRVIVNSDNQIKFDDREIAQKNDIKVDDVKVNGISVVTNKIANIDTTAMETEIADLIAENKEQAKQIEEDQRRITNLEYASKGVLYREEESESVDYTKDILSGTMPYATFDMLGGKTEVVNQLVVNGEAEGSDSSPYNYANIKTFATKNIAIGHTIYARAYIKSTDSQNVWLAYSDTNLNHGGNAFTTSTNYNKISFIYKVDGQYTNQNLKIFSMANDVVSWKNVVLCDLTQLFGINEPTSVDDERIKLLDRYLEAHPEYNEGSLVSANVESVVSKSEYASSLISNIRLVYSDSLKVFYWDTADLKKMGAKLKFRSFVQFADNSPVASMTDNSIKGLASSRSVIYFKDLSCTSVEQFISKYGNDYIYYEPIEETDKDIVSTKTLSQIIQKYFPNGMKSSGSVYDELDLENGKAIQRVDLLNLNTKSWTYSSDFWRSSVSENISIPTSIGNKPNLIGDTLEAKSWNDTINSRTNINQHIIAYNNSTYLVINGSTTNAPQGLLYYELATPIETPIEQTDLEYLRTLQVESGGTITFLNEEKLQVPNKETFLIKVV